MTRIALAALLIFGFFLASKALAHPHIMRVADRQEISFEEMMEDLRGVELVFVGELHDHPGHHQAQLEIIKGLQNTGTHPTIALEMFRKDSQKVLDQWVDGGISERRFLRHYEDNWSMWPKYRDIFLFARDQRIRMVGLNIPRDITRQVATRGFSSLTRKQIQSLEGVSCNVDPAYQDYIRRAMGIHHNHGDSFIRFCEAQLVWDHAMAKNLAEHLKGGLLRSVVILAGSGHSWKYGIPTQLKNYGEATFRVVLPEVRGRMDRNSVTRAEADYLWLDVGNGGWGVPK